MPKTTRYIGFCPVCERRSKVRDGKLVHHGYERPGHGFIEGDCFGVHRPPHELSDETALAYLIEVIRPQIDQTERALAQLPSADVLYKSVYVREGWGDGGYQLRAVRRNEVTEREWRSLYDTNQRRLERTLEVLGDERDRLEGLVETWQREPLETVEEEQAAKQAAKAERERVAQDKREAKMADMVVRYQKRLDSAVRTRNLNTIAEIYDSSRVKLMAASGREATGEVDRRGRRVSRYRIDEQQALALLDRDRIWRAFGLVSGGAYLSPREPEGKEILSAMRSTGYGYAKPGDARYVEWPPELGEGKPRRRRRR